MYNFTHFNHHHHQSWTRVLFFPPVVIKPPVPQKSVGEAASVSLQSDNNTISSGTQMQVTQNRRSVKNPFLLLFVCSCTCVHVCQCADVESPDVILIKDEDDVGGCGPDVGEEAVFVYLILMNIFQYFFFRLQHRFTNIPLWSCLIRSGRLRRPSSTGRCWHRDQEVRPWFLLPNKW